MKWLSDRNWRMGLSLLVLTVLVLFACTKRNNLTGDNWSDAHPLIARDTTFIAGFSYKHAGKISGKETTLLCGNFDGKTSMVILQFTGLPDTMTVNADTDSIPCLYLVPVKRSPLSKDPLRLTFYKLAHDWAADSTSNIQDADLSDLAIEPYTVPDSVSATDTLKIHIPADIIQNWKTAGVTGFNLAIKVQTDGWLELKSYESLSGAKLMFTYTLPGNTTSQTYNSRVAKDSYRVTGDQADIVNNVWNCKNLYPQRLFIQSLVPNSLFKDVEGNQLSEADVKRLTINKAELILFTKPGAYYTTSSASFFPYNEKDTLSVPRVLVDDNLQLITGSIYSYSVLNSDSVKINITPLMQGWTSGELKKRGMVVKLGQEMLNYGNMEFWHFLDAPVGKKPYFRIIYTSPILKGH